MSALRKTISNFYDLKINTERNRKRQVILTKIRTGHTRLPHLHILNNGSLHICDTCNVHL